MKLLLYQMVTKWYRLMKDKNHFNKYGIEIFVFITCI